MPRFSPIWPCLCALAASLACDDATRVVSITELMIESPVDGEAVFSLDTFTFRATASNAAGIRSLALLAGEREVKRCDGGASDSVSCDVVLNPTDLAGQIEGDLLTLTARSVDASDATKEAVARVSVSPLVVKFIEPSATVTGSAPLTLAVRSQVPVTNLSVVDETGMPLQQWVSEPYTATIDWPAMIGAGVHRLTATATDASGRLSAAVREVTVACRAEAECDIGEHCCGGACVAAACP